MEEDVQSLGPPGIHLCGFEGVSWGALDASEAVAARRRMFCFMMGEEYMSRLVQYEIVNIRQV